MMSFPIVSLMLLGTYASLSEASQSASKVIDVERLGGSSTHGASLITPGPRISHQELLARANFDTCGYVSGNAASPLTCPSGYDCKSTIQFMPAWACCNQVQCQGNYHTCIDYGGLDICENIEDSCSSIYTSILYCSKDAPSCFVYARSTSIGDESVFYSIGCGQSNNDIPALASPTGGQQEQQGTTTAKLPASNAQSTTPSTSTSTPDSSTSSSPKPNDKDKSSGLSSGTITGIVIPVVAMVVAVIVAWWRRHQVVWLLTCGRRGHRHSKRPDRIAVPSHAPSPYGSQPGLVQQQNFLAPPAYTHGAPPPLSSSAGYGGGPKYGPIPQTQHPNFSNPNLPPQQQGWQGGRY